MRNYKETSIGLGYSDIASLVVVGYVAGKGAVAQMLSMGGDGSYKGYVVDDERAIPGYYKKVMDYSAWLRIYDDTGLVYSVEANHIAIYRAGDYGIVILTEDKRPRP